MIERRVNGQGSVMPGIAFMLMLSISFSVNASEPILPDTEQVYRFDKTWEMGIERESSNAPDKDISWSEVILPVDWNEIRFNADEAVVLRKFFFVPKELGNRNLGISTGMIRYTCTFFVNGVGIGSIGNQNRGSYPGGLWDTIAYFLIPASLIKAGEPNELVIKLPERYEGLNLDSLAMGKTDTMRKLVFFDRIRFKFINFLAAVTCILLLFPLLFFFVFRRKETHHLYTFFSILSFAVFSIMSSFEIPPIDFAIFYGLSMAVVGLSVGFITITVWSFYFYGRKYGPGRLVLILINIATGLVYFFLDEYSERNTYHTFHILAIIMPQIASVIALILYECLIKKNKADIILLAGIFLVMITGVMDSITEISGRAPLIWFSPIGVVAFAMTVYIQIARHYIFDMKEAQRAASRLHYTEILTKEKERLEVTLNTIGDAVICTDPKGNVTFWNDAASRLAGYDKKRAVSRPLYEVIRLQAEDSESRGEASSLCVHENLIEGILAADDFSSEAGRPYMLEGQNGTRYSVLFSRAEIKDTNKNIVGLVWIFHDMTNRENLEKIYERNQILESVGMLAGGIAHDFNAILSRVMLNINLVKKSELASCPEIGTLIQETAHAIARAGSLTNQLLTFSRGANPHVQYCDLRPLIMASAGYALEGCAGVRVTYNLAHDLLQAEVDAGQIAQVIYNLVTNAVDALSNGGDIRISGENITVDSQMPFLENGIYVLVKISDNGIGIKKEHLARVFDPYFTTKQSGTGFGLTNAFSVIKSHKGHIEVHSEESKGTSFSIYLKARDDKTGHA